MPKVEDRLTAFFTDLANKNQSSRVHLPISLSELASYLGTSPETLSRQMTLAAQEGRIIKLGRGNYQVKR
ncbi:transcriptional activator FtrB [Scardovia inopinata]|uniref:HTH crp-type domain-containing protein n=1 Tax=Scardovia inopinata F0304 TaxID=641146 RepID=W5IH47_SCAIO|nr:helix-turn-helix domain-containing protein [Scardovia inopinata]EFG26325.1 hypothetical protein HMPREF9020_01410 [Scardovia inopinata F0304]BAR07039.1 putative transcriptional regulator [Scardovia inopinata JCM 12537]SUV51108.1 transcriptional activator FtrB [Scardovia inopinata]